MLTISLAFGENSESAKNVREHKGNSIIDFPQDCTVIDIETTGLDPRYDSIIEVSAIRYRNGIATESFSSLVKPPLSGFAPSGSCRDAFYYVNEFITNLTGITNEMLESAPALKDVLPKYIEFLGTDFLVGHNVNFDINFLYDDSLACCKTPLANDFIDTLRIARRVLKELSNHRLDDLIEHYELPERELHRSLSDCEATWLVYQRLYNDVLRKHESVEEFKLLFKKKYAPHIGLEPSTQDFDESHPLYGKTCVFTGTLEKMLRHEAMQIVVDAGGNCGNSITKKTNFLVLGNNDYCSSIKDGKSTKQKKAEEYILNGCDLQIISEDVFYDLIGEC